MLTKDNFNTRAVIPDNHRSNICAYQYLLNHYLFQEKNNCISNPLDTIKHIYLMFEVYLIKNMRNNLLASRYFKVPESDLSLPQISHKFPSGEVHWSYLYTIDSLDNVQSAHLRQAPKINYSVLHPGNNTLSVPLALAIFEPTTTTALLHYIPHYTVTPSFLKLFHFMVADSECKGKIPSYTVGNALVSNDEKISFLRKMNAWLTEWRDSNRLGLTRQTFNALIWANDAIVKLCSDLFESGYQFILTGRLQTDPLERRFSLYRRMSGGRFLFSLKERMKTLLKQHLKLADFVITSTETDVQIQQFIQYLAIENFDHLQLSEGTQQVAVYIAGYITHSVIKDTSCADCPYRHKDDQVTNLYFNTLNRGGLNLPSKSFNYYVQTALCLIEEIQLLYVILDFCLVF